MNALLAPMQLFSQAPPLSRTWVSLSMLTAILLSSGKLDVRLITFDPVAILYRGEWWRLFSSLFYMGDSLKSITFYMQLKNLLDTVKVLELVKYRWDPKELVSYIGWNTILLAIISHILPANPSMLFLSTPMVMSLLYIYARSCGVQPMPWLMFFSIRAGWLPFAQMLQDYLQVGDVTPNLMGVLAGHIYYYLKEVMPRLLLPDKPHLHDIANLLMRGKPVAVESDQESSVQRDEDEEDVGTSEVDASQEADSGHDEA
jgi:Derlin-2/3